MIHALIREAHKSDLPAIKSLTAELIQSLEGLNNISIQQAFENSKNLLHDSHYYFFVAERQKTIVGFITFTIRKTILHQGFSGLINELVVSEKYRRKGIGKQLIATTIERCKQLGCCEVEVSTEKTNRKATELYRKCGFEEKGFLFEVDL
jgi:ribosomal protein S18 acetylase RimI-like enzyme